MNPRVDLPVPHEVAVDDRLVDLPLREDRGGSRDILAAVAPVGARGERCGCHGEALKQVCQQLKKRNRALRGAGSG